MTSTFDRQLEPCARNGFPTSPPAVAKDSFLPPASRSSCDQLADSMTAHRTQAAFLKALIAYDHGEASHQLQASLAKAHQENRCVYRTMFVMLMLLLLSVAGLSYCAILLPRVFSDSTHLVMRSLSIVGFASSICLLELTGYLLWQRFAVARLHEECRRRVLLLIEPHIRGSLSRNPAVDSRQESGSSRASAPIQQPELSAQPL